MTPTREAMEALRPCPFCGTADPFRDDHHGDDRDPRSGRTITCRESTCQAYMFRAQCWHDDEHTRLDTVEEMDAALAARWNRRAAAALATLEKMEGGEADKPDNSSASGRDIAPPSPGDARSAGASAFEIVRPLLEQLWDEGGECDCDDHACRLGREAFNDIRRALATAANGTPRPTPPTGAE